MDIMYYDKNKNNIKCFNGELYQRPFVNDMVFIDDILYDVLSVAIDYDANQIVVIVD